MAFQGGGKGYRCRKITGASTPLTQPYAKAANDTVAIKAGHPLTKGAGITVSRSAVGSGYLTDTKILGFAVSDDKSVGASTYAGFGIAIPPVAPAVGGALEQVQVHIADDDTEFEYALTGNTVAALSLVGTTAGFKQEDATTDLWTLDPAAGSNKIAVITSIPSDQIGKAGGRVGFQIVATARQFPTP